MASAERKPQGARAPGEGPQGFQNKTVTPGSATACSPGLEGGTELVAALQPSWVRTVSLHGTRLPPRHRGACPGLGPRPSAPNQCQTDGPGGLSGSQAAASRSLAQICSRRAPQVGGHGTPSAPPPGTFWVQTVPPPYWVPGGAGDQGPRPLLPPCPSRTSSSACMKSDRTAAPSLARTPRGHHGSALLRLALQDGCSRGASMGRGRHGSGGH